MEYDLTPEPKKITIPIPPLAKQLMGLDSQERSVELDEKGLLAEDIDCRQCSYNLRGLDVQSRCPECGTSIGWSIHGNFLRYSDPDWVKQLSAGALWIVISILVTIGLTLFNVLIPFASAGVITQLIVTGISMVGYWKLTTPDPGHAEANSIWNIRQMTRILAAVGFVGLTLNISISLTFAYSSSVQLLNEAGAVILQLMNIVAALLLFILMRRIALRIPNDSIASQTRIVMWGLIGSFAVLLIGAIFAFLSIGTSSGGMISIGVFWIFGCAWLVGYLVFGIWWIVLLFKYRSALNASADMAMRTWMRQASATFYPQ